MIQAADIELVRVHHTGERDIVALPSGGLREQVFILAEENTTEFCGTVEQRRV